MNDQVTRAQLLDVFENIDSQIDGPHQLCLIDAAAVICHGAPDRRTHAVKAWGPATTLDGPALRAMAEKAGIGWDPAEGTATEPHIRIIWPGTVPIPEYSDGKWSTGSESDILWQGGRLTVSAPPAAVLVAVNLARATLRAIDDSVYLIASRSVTRDDVRQAIAALPDEAARQAAGENMIHIDMMLD